MITDEEMYGPGVTYEVTYPGLDNVIIKIQRHDTYVQWTDQDGLINQYKLIGYPSLPANGIEVKFRKKLMRPSTGEVLQTEEWLYLEADEKVFFMNTAVLPLGEHGLKQSINGMIRRNPAFGGNPQQAGPSAFMWDGTPLTLLVFECVVNPEIINVTLDALGVELSVSAQADGQIEVNVIQGDAPFEYSLDSQNWQDSNVFNDLPANIYPVFVRSKDLSSAGPPPFQKAPPRYQLVTLPADRNETTE